MKTLFAPILIIILLITTFLNSCSHSETDKGSYGKSEFLFNPFIKSPPENWEVIDNEGADFALASDVTGGLFIINTACKKGKNISLENLANSLLAGIENLSISSNKIINFQNRDAKLIEAQGSLDGIKRYLKILTTIHEFCVYDFSLISTNQENHLKDSIEFDKFLEKIKIN